MRRIKHRSLLAKRAHRGFRGYPAATIALYGPDNQRASRVAVGIVLEQGAEPVALKRWFSNEGDVRTDPAIGTEIGSFLEQHGAKTVVMPSTIIGCPHEEGIDYPDGGAQRPFWAHRDRFTGELLQ